MANYQRVPLPSAPSVTLSPNATLQPPLSRLGHGPGLILLTAFENESFENDTLDPEPSKKWAEVGDFSSGVCFDT